MITVSYNSDWCKQTFHYYWKDWVDIIGRYARTESSINSIYLLNWQWLFILMKLYVCCCLLIFFDCIDPNKQEYVIIIFSNVSYTLNRQIFVNYHFQSKFIERNVKVCVCLSFCVSKSGYLDTIIILYLWMKLVILSPIILKEKQLTSCFKQQWKQVFSTLSSAVSILSTTSIMAKFFI